MASSKAPKHDFAPAWLKIPEQDSGGKPSGGKSAEQHADKMGRPGRRDDYYNSYNTRYPGSPDYPYQPLQRQRSFDNYYDAHFDRRFSPGGKFRHHSMDDEYYNGPYGGYPPYYNGYNYDKYAPPYRSQPSLYRDGKYQHPNARYSQGPPGPPGPNPGLGPGPFHMNGGPLGSGPPYPPYYDPYYDYYHADPGYYGGYGMRPPPSNKRSYPDSRERHLCKGDKDSKDKSSSEKLKDDDFPSLNGEVSSSTDNNFPSSGAWEKTVTKKLLTPDDNKSSSSCSSSVSAYPVTSDSSTVDPRAGKMYKAQLPNKSILVRKLSKDNIKVNGKDVNSNNAVKEPDSPPIVITPKHSDTTIHLTNNHTPETGRVIEHSHHSEEGLVNGFKDLSVSPNENLLSSSLELEQRLLKEMGWNEADDEEYIITEDEVKEFENLKKNMDEKRSEAGGIPPPKRNSPQHVTIFSPQLTELIKETQSSDDDDEDSESDDSDSDIN